MAPAPEELPKEEEYDFQAAIRIALTQTDFEPLLQEFEFTPMRDAFMLDIVGNTVCADSLDYAQRDSHFAGLRLDYDSNRIAENFDSRQLRQSLRAEAIGKPTETATCVERCRTAVTIRLKVGASELRFHCSRTNIGRTFRAS